MRSGKPPSFPFYPQDFLSSHAVQRMRPAALGGYIKLLCNAWLSDEPGTLPSDDETLQVLSGLNGEWHEMKPEIMRAFVVCGAFVTQPKMQEIREAQRKRYEQAQAGASITNELRRTAYAQRTPTLPTRVRTAVTLSSSSSISSSSSKEEKTKTRRFAPDPAFENLWKAYPNRKGKEAALRAWKKLDPETQEKILPAVEAQKRWPEFSDPRFIPHLATWLNRGGWFDEPRGASEPDGPAYLAPGPATRSHSRDCHNGDPRYIASNLGGRFDPECELCVSLYTEKVSFVTEKRGPQHEPVSQMSDAMSSRIAALAKAKSL